MATTITNQSSTTYQFTGSTDTLTTTSNINQVVLEDFQGLSITKTSSVREFSAGEIITYTIRITNNSSHYLIVSLRHLINLFLKILILELYLEIQKL